jgi:hypothetical protein
MANGLLSYEQATRLQHASVAMQPVQDRRDHKRVPQGLRLHQYANLYFHARNPMLFKRFAEAPHLCVLQVSTEVLALEGTVITDCNAASDWVRFLHPRQWALVDFDDVFAADWRHPGNPPRYYQHKSRKCAEVLVPHRISPHLIIGGIRGNYGDSLLNARNRPPPGQQPILSRSPFVTSPPLSVLPDKPILPAPSAEGGTP